MTRQKICLNMIVKDEATLIERCLTSVFPFIDYWVIVDTGSSDGTQQMIRSFMHKKNIPGELHERPWINFAHNRNEALELAKNKADYTLFMDADDYLEHPINYQIPLLDGDIYFINVYQSGVEFRRAWLLRNEANYKWEGETHEHLVLPMHAKSAILENIRLIFTAQGQRSSDPKKYLEDIQILEKLLKDDPNNTRYVFFLAQSYQSAGQHLQALEAWERRIAMGGWEQEVFWAMLQKANLQVLNHFPSQIFIESYHQAFEFRPSRAEPAYFLASYYRQNGEYALAHRIASAGLSIPMTTDQSVVLKWIYEYGLLFEFALTSFYLEKYAECQSAAQKLLENTQLPDHIRSHMQNYLTLSHNLLLIKKLQ
jgi:tetratricopeptide (TPR) repeat protein